ncbi:ABC transporter ATP-binding protein [soil metagenome]
MAAELELRGITKRFGAVLANDAVDLSVEAGDIHAVVGENGAGKSTLMSILYGLLPPDDGTIAVRGEETTFASPLEAIEAGLGMVHQSFQLFPTMSVAENVVFRREPTRRGLIDRSASVAAVHRLAEAYGLSVDPTAAVEDLSVGVLQRVEILKALYRDARVLILDEPTAVLTPQERDRLFEVLRLLRADGRTIVFITHKLGEVMTISDRVTVLRRGRSVADLVTAETTATEISHHMTGRNVELTRSPPMTRPGPPVLTVGGLFVVDDHGLEAVGGVDITVRAGEIVGLAGVAGNGQSELVEAITGLRPAAEGRVRLGEADITSSDVASRRRAGMAYIPEDRHRVGTARAATVEDNLLMGFQSTPSIATRGWLDLAAVAEHANALVARFDVKVSSMSDPVGTLSGGNLQKVVVAREMAHEAPLLIAEQPTRGVDVGAIEFVHAQLTSFRDAGGAVLLVSAELSEIQTLSSRILVMFEGSLVAELDPDEVTEVDIGLHMTGSGAAHA